MYANIIYKNFVSDQELEVFFTARRPQLGLLVRELTLKFPFKVHSFNVDKGTVKFCHEDGFMAGYAYTRINDGKLVYCYRSYTVRKARGRTNEDQYTFFSTKLGNLIKSLEKLDHKRLLPFTFMASVSRLIGDSIRKKLGTERHPPANSFDYDMTMTMAKRLLGESVAVDMSLLKREVATYDKWIEGGKLADVASAAFLKQFTVVGQDGAGEFIIGKGKARKKSVDNDYEFSGFNRYRSIDDVPPELVPILTMIKVAYNEESRYIPVKDTYNEDLDVAMYYPSYPDVVTCSWAFITEDSSHEA